MKKNNLILSAFVMFLPCISVFSQLSNQLNQFMVYQPMVNYASASSYETFNAAIYYRNQWVGFSGAPKSYGFSVSFPGQLKNTVFGIAAFTDKVGVHSNSSVELNYAYSIKVNNKSNLSFSLSPQVRFLSGEYSSVVSNDLADPILFNNYQLNVIPNVKFGSYYYRNRFYLGLATSNLLYNNVLTTGVETSFNPNQMGWFLHSGYQLKVNEKNEVVFSTLIKEQKGASLHGELNAMWLLMEGRFGIGASYRTSNDLVGVVNFELLKQWRLSYAFQGALSKMSSYQNGTHEIMLIYEMVTKKHPTKLIIPRF